MTTEPGVPTETEAVESESVTVRELTREESWALLDAETRRRLGISAQEFAARLHAGAYGDPDDDPFIMRMAMDLQFLEQNEPTDLS